MNQRSVNSFCAAMLLFSVLIRAMLSAGLEVSAAAQPPAPPGRVWTLIVEPPDEPAPLPEAQQKVPEPPQPAYTRQDADGILFSSPDSGIADKLALLRQPSTLDCSADGPKVLIVHTHSSEAYTKTEGFAYESSDPYRTEQAEYSVIRVGTELAAALEAAGIETLHDTSLNDYPVYSGAYDRMLPKIEAALAAHPSVQLVLDVHRDAVENPDGTQASFAVTENGTRMAQIMLVVGTDRGGLPHPGWQENLANAMKLQATLNRLYPGLCRPLDLRNERFNAHVCPGAMLAEFGAAGNTLPEAIASARAFADALAVFLRTEAKLTD